MSFKTLKKQPRPRFTLIILTSAFAPGEQNSQFCTCAARQCARAGSSARKLRTNLNSELRRGRTSETDVHMTFENLWLKPRKNPRTVPRQVVLGFQKNPCIIRRFCRFLKMMCTCLYRKTKRIPIANSMTIIASLALFPMSVRQCPSNFVALLILMISSKGTGN